MLPHRQCERVEIFILSKFHAKLVIILYLNLFFCVFLRMIEYFIK